MRLLTELEIARAKRRALGEFRPAISALQEQTGANAETCYAAALLYRFTDDSAALAHAADILRQYADGGATTYQQLNEALFALRVFWAYDAIADAIPDALALREKLLQPLVKAVQNACTSVTHNVECWRRATLLTGAVVLDSEELRKMALRGTGGIDQQLREGVRRDGLWFERSVSAHYDALHALLWAARAEPRVRGDWRLPAMFAGPRSLLWSDGSFLVLGNGSPGSRNDGYIARGVPNAVTFAALAHAWFSDAPAAKVWHHQQTQGLASVEALIYGADQVVAPTADRPVHAVSVSIESGFVKVKHGELETFLSLGTQTGFHEHRDALGLSWHARNRPVSVDLGSGHDGDDNSNEWFRSPQAHNRLVIHGMKEEAPAHLLRSFGASGDGHACIDAEIVTQQPAPTLSRRRILQKATYAIDLVTYQCEQPCDVELWMRLLPGSVGPASDGAISNVKFLADAVKHTPKTAKRWRDPSGVSYLVLDATSEVVSGLARDNPPPARVPAIVRRQHAKSGWFCAILTTDDALSAEIEAADGSFRVVVRTAHGIEQWSITPDSETIGGVVPAEDVTPLSVFMQHTDKDLNPYTRSLIDALHRHGVVVRSLPLFTDWPTALSTPAVIHYHWPSYEYYSTRLSEEEQAQRADKWLSFVRGARGAGHGVVWTSHNLYPHERVYPLLDKRARHEFIDLCTGVISLGHAAAKLVSEALHPRVTPHVVTLGHYLETYDPPVDRAAARHALGLPDDAFIYMTFGNVLPYKNIERIIEAFDDMPPDALLLVVGGGLDEAYLDKLRGLARHRPQVRLALDWVLSWQVPLWFGAADVFVTAFAEILTSSSVVLALSQGCGVIAPRLGCVPEYISDDVGILFDDERPLKQALASARGLTDVRSRALRAASRLDWDGIALQTRRAYSEALALAQQTRASGTPWPVVGSAPSEETAVQEVRDYFEQALPKRLQALAVEGVLPGLVGKYELGLLGSSTGGPWYLHVEETRAWATEEHCEPDVSMQSSAVDFLRMLRQETSAMELFLAGRLIGRAGDDPRLQMALGFLLGLP